MQHLLSSQAWTFAVTLLQSILSNFWIQLDPSVGTHAEVEAAQVREREGLLCFPCRLLVATSFAVHHFVHHLAL